MDTHPEEQEGLYKALYNCNQSLPDDNRFVVPFICVSAVPYGRLYKENLEGIPTVTDTYNALLNCDKTNQVAIPLIKFALCIAGCPYDRIEQIEGTSVQEESLQRDHNNEYASEISQGLRFHELLMDIINGLPSDQKRQVISMSSGHLLSNPIHTELLHVQFLQLIQANVIGRNDVTKLHSWFQSIRRYDILDLIDKYCTQVGVSILPRQDIQLPMQRPLVDVHDRQPIQETAREGSRLLATNHGSVHNKECHIVEQDNPTGPKKDQTDSELETCANGSEYTGEPHSTARSAAKCCDDAMCKGPPISDMQTGQKRKCVLTLLAAKLLMLIGLVITFLVFQLYPSKGGQTFLQASDVVTLSSHGFDPFLYTTVTVTRKDSETHVVDASKVKLYLQTCSKLVPSHRPIYTKVTHIDSSNEDHRFFVYQGYLVKGSNTSFDVNITARKNFTKCSVALYIFQDYECFSNFLYFGSVVNDCTTRKTCLHISSTFDKEPPYVFMADETSYYFVVLSAPRGIDGVNDIYFQTTGMQLYYTTGDLPPICSVVTGINSSCSMSLPSQSVQLSMGKTVCVLAVIMEDSTDTNSENYTTSSENYNYNTSVYTNLIYSSSTAHNPAHNIATLVTLVSLLFVTTVIVVTFCICIRCSVCRSHDHHYQPLSYRPGRE